MEGTGGAGPFHCLQVRGGEDAASGNADQLTRRVIGFPVLLRPGGASQCEYAIDNRLACAGLAEALRLRQGSLRARWFCCSLPLERTPTGQSRSLAPQPMIVSRSSRGGTLVVQIVAACVRRARLRRLRRRHLTGADGNRDCVAEGLSRSRHYRQTCRESARSAPFAACC